MTRRRKIAVALIAVALAISTVAVVAAAVRGPTLERRLEQVRQGMTYVEVVAILGEPDGRIPTSGSCFLVFLEDGQGGTAWVDFDVDGTVISTAFTRAYRSGFLDRVLAWFGL